MVKFLQKTKMTFIYHFLYQRKIVLLFKQANCNALTALRKSPPEDVARAVRDCLSGIENLVWLCKDSLLTIIVKVFT